MNLWAIVPVKALDESKSRLRSELTPNQRAKLSREMLLHTLQILSGIPEIEHTLVISADPEVLTLADEYGAQVVKERGSPSLNKALSQATALAKDSSAKAVLVLPADLPLIQAADVRALIELARDPPVAVLSPDRRRSGTNALLVSPAGALEYAFGPDSYNLHIRQAAAFGVRIEIVELPALGLDLDAPEDLEIYRERYALIKE